MIVRFANEGDIGAYSDLYWSRQNKSPVVLSVFAEGVVVNMRERNMYDDSDFYATYWNGEKFVEECYASTRGWTYPCCANIDASPELMAQYRDWMMQVEENCAAIARKLKEDLAAKEFRKGKVVRVVNVKRGKLMPYMGREGRVFWVGFNNYGESVGVEFTDTGEKAFFPGGKLEILAKEVA